ncbi:MAG: hypothetical protein PHR30_13750 [Gallionellaceae bacterium]|nr:hypothetical protein [Gallionellaceae bacterium]MDD5366398.1 hypothetical protein [Gallionellaceae bacterium]
MTTKSMATPLARKPVFPILRRELYKFLLALGLGQDGPAGKLPEDLITRRA